jgi:hypothetical protein
LQQFSLSFFDGDVSVIIPPSVTRKEDSMSRGDKSSYSSKQVRRAKHIEEGYEKRGLPAPEAKRRAWATENKISGGGRVSGSGRGKSEDHEPMSAGGRIGGRSVSPAKRAAAGQKAAATRLRRGK